MDSYDYHFISLKFLTAIIMAFFFAFLLIYVFSPLSQNNYAVYNFEKEKIAEVKTAEPLADFKTEGTFIDLTAKNNFKEKLKTRSFAVIDQSQQAILTVITANHLGAVNSLQEKEDILLSDFEQELLKKEEELLQQKRKELETEISSKLQNLRQQIREEYSGYSQQQIRKNYLKLINLRIAAAVLAYNEADKIKYQKQLEQLRAEQDELLAAKNKVLTQEISEQTTPLIMDFNRRYSDYRKQLRAEHQKLMNKKEAEVEQKLANYRQKIKLELKTKRAETISAMAELISETKELY